MKTNLNPKPCNFDAAPKTPALSASGVRSAVGCDRMCDDCTSTCTRDYGHSGPHRCDRHARG